MFFGFFLYTGDVFELVHHCTPLIILIYGSQNRLRLIDDHAVDIVLKGEFM